MALLPTTKNDASKLLTNAKTIAVTLLTSPADINDFVKTLRKQLLASVLVGK